MQCPNHHPHHHPHHQPHPPHHPHPHHYPHHLPHVQDILEEADTDKNGLIDYAEFANMMEPGRRFAGLH